MSLLPITKKKIQKHTNNSNKLSPRLLLRRRMSGLLFKQSCDYGLVELTSLGLSQTCKPMDDLLPELLKQPAKDS